MTACYGPRNMSTSKRTLIQIRVTPEEKQWVEGAAASAGMTVSDFTRSRIFSSPPTGNAAPYVSPGSTLTRVTSNAALYATTSQTEALEQRISTLEQTPGVAEASAKAQKHIQKKPTT